jgi:hypothetical protein
METETRWIVDMEALFVRVTSSLRVPFVTERGETEEALTHLTVEMKGRRSSGSEEGG